MVHHFLMHYPLRSHSPPSFCLMSLFRVKSLFSQLAITCLITVSAGGMSGSVHCRSHSLFSAHQESRRRTHGILFPSFFLCFCFSFSFQGRVSRYSPGWPQTCVPPVSLGLPSIGITGECHHTWLRIFSFSSTQCVQVEDNPSVARHTSCSVNLSPR